MSGEEKLEKRENSVGKGWLGCLVGAFALTSVLFWLPWEAWLGQASANQAAKAVLTLLFKVFMLGVWPLNWLASTVGYAAASSVGLVIAFAIPWIFPEKRCSKKWRETVIGMSAVAGFFVFMYGLFGLQSQANTRALDFAKSPTPSGVFQVIDDLNPAQVQAVRKSLAANADPEVLFEQVAQTAGVGASYKNTGLYAPGLYQSGLGFSFLTLFAEKDESVMSGPVCEKVRQNYLKSAVTDRYELLINDVVVSASSGSCKSLMLNEVSLNYRGAFATP